MQENETKTQNKKGLKVLKTVLNVIINILIVIVLITSLLIAVMALTSQSSGISTIFGYTIQSIQSDSMKGGSPDGYGGKEFEKGDLMIAKATDFDIGEKYEVGDIVTYAKTDTDNSTMLIVHRIVDVAKDKNGDLRYQTWGDNRKMDTLPDQQDVEDYLRAGDIGSLYYSSDYEGIIIKGVGTALDYLRTQQGFFLVVLLPMIIFFMYELIRVVLNATNYRKAKAEEDRQAAVNAAVAEATAGKQNAEGISNMSPEQMEQFKQFLEFQRQQKSIEENKDTTEDNTEQA